MGTTNIKSVAITASTRKNSNSILAAKTFLNAINKTITLDSVEFVDLNAMKIGHCEACLNCRKNFTCVKKDDGGRILKKISGADLVVVASPVYYMGAPSKLKTLIDRSQPEWSRQLKHGKKKIRTGAVILTADDSDKDTFAGAINEIKSFLAVNGAETAAVATLGGMHAEGAFERSQSAKSKIIRLARQLAKSMKDRG